MENFTIKGIRGEARVYECQEDLEAALADHIAHLSETSVMDRGYFAVALTGGSLISSMRKLCEVPYTRTVDWTRWYVFWTDERVVSKTHDDSNYKHAIEKFLSKVPILSSHVFSINDSLSAEDAAVDYQFVLRQLVKTRTVSASETGDCPKFDLILLGMGSDGHVASLFPSHSTLEYSTEWVIHMTDAPEAPPERITFTVPVINAAANVVMVVTGEAKAEAAKIAIGSKCEGADTMSALPAQLVHPSDGKLVWFLDKAAASKLDAASKF